MTDEFRDERDNTLSDAILHGINNAVDLFRKETGADLTVEEIILSADVAVDCMTTTLRDLVLKHTPVNNVVHLQDFRKDV